jgi:superfamily II DNA or RNA helicase
VTAQDKTYTSSTADHVSPEVDFNFDYLIVDESHAGLDDGCIMLRTIMKKSCTEDTRVLLVSATPWDLLLMEEFKDAPVLKRPLDQGFKDGLVTDFRFHAEEAKITFTEEDFTRKGDLGKTAVERQMAILKSACIGKMEYLIDTYDKELGAKVLVICPPGNVAEIARTLAARFHGLAFIEFKYSKKHQRKAEMTADTRGNLARFKAEKKIRFLFVVNKCQVGFDMPELTSVIDLTMSRNIKVLAQRCGRVARKKGISTSIISTSTTSLS